MRLCHTNQLAQHVINEKNVFLHFLYFIFDITTRANDRKRRTLVLSVFKYRIVVWNANSELFSKDATWMVSDFSEFLMQFILLLTSFFAASFLSSVQFFHLKQLMKAFVLYGSWLSYTPYTKSLLHIKPFEVLISD